MTEKKKQTEAVTLRKLAPSYMLEDKGSKEIAAEMKVGETKFIARVVGTVSKAKPAKSNFDQGDSYAFKGKFLAVRYDGKQFTSTTAFFPEDIQDALLEAVANGETDIRVEIDYSIKRVDEKKSPVGFMWDLQPVRPFKVSGDLAAMLEEANTLKALPALSAPAKK